MRRAAAVLVALAASATADDSTRTPIHARDAPLHKDTATAAELAALEKCGQDRLDTYNKDPEAKTNDVVLFEGATCFLRAHKIGAAITMFNVLRKYYPSSAPAKTAAGTLGMLYAGVGFYDRAAQNLEDYAKLYPKEADALDALADAAFFRAASNDPGKELDDAQRALELFGTSRPADTAKAVFDHLQGNEDAVKRYLAALGDKGGADRRVMAQARIAWLNAESSCTSMVDGLCGIEARNLECGIEALAQSKRDPEFTRRAREALVVAQKSFDDAGKPAAARHSLAVAELAVADIDLDPAAYDAVIARGDPEVAVQATRRKAQVAESAATCASRDKAVSALKACVDSGAKAGVAGQALRDCRVELAWIDRTTPFPAVLPAMRVKIPVRFEAPSVGVASEKDVVDALAAFQALDAKGTAWSAGDCAAMAKRVRGSKAVEVAHFLAGLAWHRCGKDTDARTEWEAQPQAAESLASLGSLAYAQADLVAAQKMWDAATKANGKLVAPRLGLASLEFDLVRVQAWTVKLAGTYEDVRFQLANAMAMVPDDAEVLGAFAMVQAEEASKRTDKAPSARWLVERATSRGGNAITSMAAAWLAVRDGSWAAAVDAFHAAKTADGWFDAAELEIELGRYADAKTDIDRVGDKSYDAMIVTAAALAGLGKIADAEKVLGEAKKLDRTRGEAWWELGALALAKGDKAGMKAARDAFYEAELKGVKDARAIVKSLDGQLGTP